LAIGTASCISGSRHHPREIQRLVFVAIRRTADEPAHVAGYDKPRRSAGSRSFLVEEVGRSLSAACS
jgi:hypothetical protein